MKRTDKHAKETAKSARQPAFKLPAQELTEFKDTVLAMKHGRVLWSILTRAEDKDQILEEFASMLAAPAIFQRLFPSTLIDKARWPIVRDAPFSAGMRELESQLDKLWPEYAHLLERNPDERRAYRQRYKRFLNQNPPPQDRVLRQERGRPRDRIVRDELIVKLCQQAPLRTDQQIAHVLAHEYGITISRQAVRQARNRDQERRRLQTPKLNPI